MKRFSITIIFLVFICSFALAQKFKFHIGAGLDLDMGVRIDDNLAPDHMLGYQNTALASADIFSTFSYKKFNITPDFRISWATFGKGKRTAVNLSGTSIPEGNNISIGHQGNFAETLERDPYLLDRSNVTVSLMSVGLFLTRDFFCSKLGNFEAGTGFFYDIKRVYFKEYLAHDVYDYFGSSGSHTSQYQTDEYVFKETVKAKKPAYTNRMVTYGIKIPAIIKYDFIVGNVVVLSPAFVAYIGKDSYYQIKFSVGLGNNHTISVK